jgi:dienelactone hydrolase
MRAIQLYATTQYRADLEEPMQLPRAGFMAMASRFAGAALIHAGCIALSGHALGAEPGKTFGLSYWQDERLTEKVTMTPVTDNGLIAELYQPKGQRRSAAILTLGACTLHSPRDFAQGLASEGYVTLALFYCGPNTKTDQLAEVPLEYMKTAIDWLLNNPSLDIRRVGVAGASQGAQAALITAATYRQVAAVLAVAPSDVVSAALGPPPDRIKSAPRTSSWSLGGVPVPYLPHGVDFGSDAYPEASIAVERINGPVLLISGTQDKAWPSSLMADKIMKRLKAHNFRFPYQHLRYADAGHGLFAAHDSADPLFAEKFAKASPGTLGGTREGNIAAQADSWPKALAFLEKALGG